ncbi:hypothetical protein Hypma_011306 [Hypsizygus marmoreus]|uniref:Uncharacterized protein n=1 Tax=Hypsizygus marmoreus TaxID=39966 RepID=A0A369JHH9_HYPMA|nr:hypothetical protein Hypma_011306 [Hypsizygus marmoreus]
MYFTQTTGTMPVYAKGPPTDKQTSNFFFWTNWVAPTSFLMTGTMSPVTHRAPFGPARFKLSISSSHLPPHLTNIRSETQKMTSHAPSRKHHLMAPTHRPCRTPQVPGTLPLLILGRLVVRVERQSVNVRNVDYPFCPPSQLPRPILTQMSMPSCPS